MTDLLELKVVPTRVITHSGGIATLQIAAGQTLKIETSPGGDDILEATVPEGKVWNTSISVQVNEEDA
jgi:hypothetical protein